MHIVENKMNVVMDELITVHSLDFLFVKLIFVNKSS